MEKNFNLFWPGWNIDEKPIGRGSFGTVYKIYRDVYGDVEEAALKVITIPQSEDEVDYLRCTGMDNDSITQTFHQQVGDIAREYKLMARMRDNPNIVRCDDFRDVQHDDGMGWDIYIKMELLTPIMKALDRVTAESEIIRLGKEICNALVACQEHNIIHRDIKPQNVFISSKGVFKLGDFGIARTVERTTRATAGIGTYNFMAPEVMKNEAYGKTADIYTLGLLLHWLLNERRSPFMPLPPSTPRYGDEDKARLRRFSGEAIPAPLHGSEELKRIVLKACAYDPKERYASAEEMLAALNALDKPHIVDESENFVVAPIVVDVEPDLPEADDSDATVGLWSKQHNTMPSGEQADIDENDNATVGLWGGQQSAIPSEENPPYDADNATVGMWSKHEDITKLIKKHIDDSDDPDKTHKQESSEQGGNRQVVVTSSKKSNLSKRERKLSIGAASFILAVFLIIGIFAIVDRNKSGWDEVNGNWFYYVDGQKVTGLWDIGDFTYYFNGSGAMLKDYKVTINENTYYFDSYGTMVTGWMSIDGDKYYFNSDGTMVTGLTRINSLLYYFEPDGTMAIGWKTIDGEKYYFASSMVTDWQNIDGERFYFDNDGKMVTGWYTEDGRSYYFRLDGTMVTGQQNIDGKTYNFGNHGYVVDSHGNPIVNGWANEYGRVFYYADGKKVTGLRNIGDHTYYFWRDSSEADIYYGEMLTDRMIKVNGNTYYFSADGTMATGWLNLHNLGPKYYFNPNGTMAIGWKMIDGDKYYFNSDGTMATRWQDIGGNRYYFGNNGVMTTGWYTFPGSAQTFYFRENGTMVTGWQNIDGKNYHFENDGRLIRN